MTPSEYRTALATLNLSINAPAAWLGVSLKTARTYATKGPSGPASRAVGMALALMGLERYFLSGEIVWKAPTGQWVFHDDIAAAVGLSTE